MSPFSWPRPGRRWVHRARVTAAASLTFAAMWFAACGKQAPLSMGENQRPTLELTQAPVTSTQPFFYAYELRWAGYDVDGHIDYFRYTIDPPTAPNSDTVSTLSEWNRNDFRFSVVLVHTVSELGAVGGSIV